MITTVAIAGMRTGHCTRAVFTALAGVEGIRTADVSLGRAVIDHDGRATAEVLRAAIAVSGYEVVSVDDERRRLA